MASEDVLVIGGGAFGLWTARACAARGLRVAVADAGRVGGLDGASATPIGALAPHLAAPWTPMKALQLRALLEMPARLGALQAETGIPCGYARLGRLQPLDDLAARERAEARAADAGAAWGGAARMRVLDPAGGGWLSTPRFGALHDDLSARLDARATLGALRDGLLRAGGEALDGWRLNRVEPDGSARFDQGLRRAPCVVLAAGWQAVQGLPDAPLPALEPEHGQAARLALSAPADAPLIGAPGLWIVPQADGTVAVGATSERGRRDLDVDAALDDVLARAAARVPALADAPVLERWAGLRPRLATRKPLIGPVTGRPGLWLAAGGFKIGLAL
ncbi:MAG: FAD-dependent oxidoreductase, partial [Pseudomonadota bacterium]